MTCQKQHNSGNIIWSALPAQRNSLRKRLSDLLRVRLLPASIAALPAAARLAFGWRPELQH
jgi:hypothetical protein